MDFKELQTKSEAELRKILGQNREKLRELRFKDSNKQLKNIREIRTVKEQVAHVLTILNKKK
ncbi:MAG: 50S ribosomal protein L29 [Candidatus Falkowbacteria bacterium]|nr:50S ribosomal protein L29 [Candidatus Falkowbacteria bacterium]MDP2944101.1 50S ribosomal protein L29 [bacterium]